jgi:hypothetical protein
MSIRGKWIFIAPLAMAGMVLFAFLGGEVVMLLWNWLLPPLFGWPVVTFWQALGLLALCRILFGGFGRHGGGYRSHRTPGERERIRQRIRARFGFGAAADEPHEPIAGGPR